MAVDKEELFFLQWNDYNTEMISSFHKLRMNDVVSRPNQHSLRSTLLKLDVITKLVIALYSIVNSYAFWLDESIYDI